MTQPRVEEYDEGIPTPEADDDNTGDLDFQDPCCALPVDRTGLDWPGEEAPRRTPDNKQAHSDRVSLYESWDTPEGEAE